MKECYEKPEISIIVFNTEDVIVTSGNNPVIPDNPPIGDGDED